MRDVRNAADAEALTVLPRWHWRRLLRGRLRPALAAAVVGALLGVAGTAWGTGNGPFAAGSRCWGALGDDEVTALFRGRDDVDARELPLQQDPLVLEGLQGTCRLSTDRFEVTARVHQLNDQYDGGGQRTHKFLGARLPEPPRTSDDKPNALCGIKGLDFPGKRDESNRRSPTASAAAP